MRKNRAILISLRRIAERKGTMKFLSQHTKLFKAAVPPVQEEIEEHIRRLNELLLAYQQFKTMTATEWIATEREIEMELQWFDIHHVKLTSTASPIPLTAVQSTDAIGVNRQLTLTHSPSR